MDQARSSDALAAWASQDLFKWQPPLHAHRCHPRENGDPAELKSRAVCWILACAGMTTGQRGAFVRFDIA